MSPIIEAPTPGTPLAMSGVPSGGTDKVQTLTITATGGHYHITFEGFTSDEIAYNDNAAAIQAHLEAIPAIGTGGCVVTGAGSPYTLTAGGNRTKQAHGTFGVDASACTGGTVTCVQATAGVDSSFRGQPKGTQVVDTATGIVYVNTGTALAPTWTKVGTQT